MSTVCLCFVYVLFLSMFCICFVYVFASFVHFHSLPMSKPAKSWILNSGPSTVGSCLLGFACCILPAGCCLLHDVWVCVFDANATKEQDASINACMRSGELGDDSAVTQTSSRQAGTRKQTGWQADRLAGCQQAAARSRQQAGWQVGRRQEEAGSRVQEAGSWQ